MAVFELASEVGAPEAAVKLEKNVSNRLIESSIIPANLPLPEYSFLDVMTLFRLFSRLWKWLHVELNYCINT